MNGMKDMKLKQTNEVRVDAGVGSAFSKLCLRSCRKILAQIRKAKAAILAEARGTLDKHERMLQLALNEAEALAWQTEFPHLVFPALAAEKVHAVADWNRHQRSVRQTEPLFALAA
jgi:hypothetical protein